MSFDKAIEYGKEHRKPYTGAQAIDRSCRNGGTCEWCQGNRHYKNNKREESAAEAIREYEEE